MTPQAWNELVQKHLPPFGGFLQSWQWGEFQAALGFPVRRIHSNGELGEIIAQCIKQPLPLGRHYWLIPKGPLGTAPIDVTLRTIKHKLPGDFIKIEPTVTAPAFRLAPERHPAHTSLLPLNAPYPDLLKAMKEKTRYNIRVAQRKGVSVRLAPMSDLPIFLELMTQTGRRDGFNPHDSSRYRGLLEQLTSPACHAFLAVAEHQGTPLAANIMIDAFGTRTYLHGASSDQQRNLMAPYALHAFLIEDAVNQGLHAYDFWGIAPPRASASHPWSGITRFKNGFGGMTVSMPGTFDAVQSHCGYTLYITAKKIKKLL